MTSPTQPANALTVTDLAIPGIVEPLSFSIPRGGRLGLIGESGSGKSLTALSIMGLMPEDLPATGTIALGATEYAPTDKQVTRRIRGKKVAMVFQEPMTALNPLMRVGRQIAEAMEVHGASRSAAAARTEQLFEDVGLPRHRLGAYPHELSGGQRQRVLIAMALANDPEVLICDEPTTALDVTVQKQILELISTLVEERGTALLFITHDLGVVSRMCDEVVVLEKGRQIESGSVAEVFSAPQHTYTRRLLEASRLGTREHPPLRLAATGDSSAGAREDDPCAKKGCAVSLEAVSRVYKRRGKPDFAAVDEVSLTVPFGRRLGLVGGSGSGKSTLLKLVAGLDRPTSGEVRLGGKPVAKLGRKERSSFVSLVFQDPASSLDPRMPVGLSIAEPLRGRGLSPAQQEQRALEVLAATGLEPEMASRLPHEFSGGQRQRISIARALAVQPRVLLADEPVSALDVSVRDQVLTLLDSLARELGLTLIFVSHDLGVVRELCSHVAVMSAGRVVEHGAVDEVWSHPQDPYTQELMSAIPRVGVAF